MIDHLLGRPSVSWKRTQVFLIILFWVWKLRRGGAEGPKVFWLRRLNHACKQFTPWQITVSVLTLMYAGRNLDSIIGLESPEPLARLYSRSYYRATWLATGLDAGFATAMTIQPKWLRDICSVFFSVYYIIYADKADEKLRKFRATATVELLRTTWEKTGNPYLRVFNAWDRPRISILKKILLPRPPESASKRPVVCWLFHDGSEDDLLNATDLILDLPGGGFICMTPRHHEERLRRWAIRCKRPVLSIEYGKAPEYPFPYAIEECFDVYKTLVKTKGSCLGMSGSELNIVMTGDSAGGNLVATVMYKILEHPEPIPQPIALVFCYPALDFNFTSWMTPAHLRVLRSEQSTSNLAGLAEQKDHYSHRSPLAVVNDTNRPSMRRGKSWTAALNLGNKAQVGLAKPMAPNFVRTRSMFRRKSNPFSIAMGRDEGEEGNVADEEDLDDDDMIEPIEECDKPIAKRVVFSEEERQEQRHSRASEAVSEARTSEKTTKKAPIGTRLTMTSRTGYFQDRIISPSMMRAMAILYIGPKRNPDFQTDYYISPILGPSALLAQFPPMLMSCGEKDPFVDDTVIFAGRVREAKRARKNELEAGRRTNKNLRMSTRQSKEDERILNETDEDWVRLAIIEGWSHGFLQMSTLMPEAREAIYRIGDWINDAFASHASQVCAAPAARQPNGCDVDRQLLGSSETETDEGLMFVPKKRRTSPNTMMGCDDEGQLGMDVCPAWEGLPGRGGMMIRGEMEGGRERVGRPAGKKPSASIVATEGGGLMLASGKAGSLVPEADLLKRRRDEAVFGIGEMRTVAGHPAG